MQLDGVYNPSWPVLFGISLSFALFIIKFVTARVPKFDDMVVGLSDIPTVLTASACSLLLAGMIRQSHASYSVGSTLAWLIVIFVANVCVFRFVEYRKRSLASCWLIVSALISLSFAASVLLSFNLVSSFYAEVGK